MLGVCETRWVKNGDFVSDKHRFKLTGGEKNEKRVELILDYDTKKCNSGMLLQKKRKHSREIK